MDDLFLIIKKGTAEKIKDLIYNVYNEFENELDDYTSKVKDNLTDEDFKIMLEFLDRFVDKVKLVINDEIED